MDDLIKRMEVARRGITLASDSDLLRENEMVKLVLKGVEVQITMWQNEVRECHLMLNDAGVEHSGQSLSDRIRLLIERENRRGDLLMKTAKERNQLRREMGGK